VPVYFDICVNEQGH